MSETGVREAAALGEALAAVEIELGVATRLVRTQETLELALGSRETARLVLPALDEIRFGAFEGGPLADYRAWAWSHEPQAECPGGGEPRRGGGADRRRPDGSCRAREEDVVLAVSHALPIRYVVDASDGVFPAARIGRVPHAVPYALEADALRLAAETLRAWAATPRFADATGEASV